MALSDEVVAEADKTRIDLAAMERNLQERIDEIDFDAFAESRDLTAAENEERQGLRASQAEVREAFQVLAYVTLRRLDDNAEVTQLHKRMAQIQNGLKDDLERLKSIQRHAETAAKVSASLVSIVGKVASII